MSFTPELATILDAALDNDRIDLHTALPATVDRVDGKKVDLILGVKRMIDNGEGVLVPEDLPILRSVSVWRYRTSKFILYLPIEKGDEGLVVFSEASMGQWLASGGASIPDEIGRHTLSSGVFLPGLVRDVTDESVSPQKDGIVLGAVNGGFVAVENDGTITAENDSGSFELSPSGQFSANGSNFTVDP